MRIADLLSGAAAVQHFRTARRAASVTFAIAAHMPDLGRLARLVT